MFDTPTGPPVIQSVAPSSPAELAGLRPGDRLIEIEGKDARERFNLITEIIYAPGATKTLVIEREGARKTVQITLGMDKKYHLGVPGFTFQDDPVIMGVVPGTPAERAGLQAGDGSSGSKNDWPPPLRNSGDHQTKADRPVRLENRGAGSGSCSA